MYPLRRVSGDTLALTREHEAIAVPRKGTVDWAGFDPARFDEATLDHAAEQWSTRSLQEMHSLALFTEIAAHLHLLGAPLDWSGAFARMIADEVRHTDLCLRMCAALQRPATPQVDPSTLHLLGRTPSRARVRHTIVAAFCIGETISGRMFRRALRAADVPLARDVVTAILVDETFHGELGWELGALLMRDDRSPSFDRERALLATELPELFRHFVDVACASRGPAWARREPEVEEGPNFGTLSHAGYARAFFDGMEEDVVPGLEAIGLPEARPAYEKLLEQLP
jgi:hypothetical protein